MGRGTPRAGAAPARAPQLAAGCLVWRVRHGRLQVLLVHRPRYGDWSWPKGKLEPGESLLECALRETAEETGRQVVVGRPLPGLAYRISGGRRKEVHYWAARLADDGALPVLRARAAVTRAAKREIDRIRWVDARAAARKLTRRSDAGPLKALLAAHEEGTLDTRALVVVRHARARSRTAWPQGEDTRPLTPTGGRRAEALIRPLAAYGVTLVVTSPWTRCRDTVAPYARAADLPLHEDGRLTETAHARRPQAVAGAVDRLVDRMEPAVICLHRPVLSTVLERLARFAPTRVSRRLPRTDPYLRTGEMLVAHVAGCGRGRRIVDVEFHRPPAQG